MKLSGNSLISGFVDDFDREKKSLLLIKNLANKYKGNVDKEYEKAIEQVKISMIYLIMRDKNLSHNNRITKIKKIDSSFNYKKYFFEKVNVYKEKFYSRFKR